MKQKEAAKISIICLVINLILAVILMQKFGAAGLAFASSLGGFLQLILYIRAFGAKRFLAIIEPKFDSRYRCCGSFALFWFNNF